MYAIHRDEYQTTMAFLPFYNMPSKYVGYFKQKLSQFRNPEDLHKPFVFQIIDELDQWNIYNRDSAYEDDSESSFDDTDDEESSNDLDISYDIISNDEGFPEDKPSYDADSEDEVSDYEDSIMTSTPRESSTSTVQDDDFTVIETSHDLTNEAIADIVNSPSLETLSDDSLFDITQDIASETEVATEPEVPSEELSTKVKKPSRFKRFCRKMNVFSGSICGKIVCNFVKTNLIM